MTRPKRLGRPRAAEVSTDAAGVPVQLGATAVDSVLEDWLVEDRWWTPRPVRRRYLELVLVNGRCVMVFRDLVGGGWYVQRG